MKYLLPAAASFFATLAICTYAHSQNETSEYVEPFKINESNDLVYRPGQLIASEMLDVRVTELERKVAGIQKQITLLHATKADKQ